MGAAADGWVGMQPLPPSRTLPPMACSRYRHHAHCRRWHAAPAIKHTFFSPGLSSMLRPHQHSSVYLQLDKAPAAVGRKVSDD